ncbi:MAG: hypothetical protein WDM96_08010 [Lacunisphaera sp.]
MAAACFGHVVIWNAATFTAQKEFPYGNAIYALTWSPDHRWLVAGCHDNAVHLWMPAEQDMELHMSGYETRPEGAVVQPRFEVARHRRRPRRLRVGLYRRRDPRAANRCCCRIMRGVCAVAFQHSHGLLAAGAANGEFTLWAPTRKKPRWSPR